MGTICMDMSSYEIERDMETTSDYSDEVLCAGWVPAVAMHQSAPEHTAMPVELATVDVESFLQKMYACQI